MPETFETALSPEQQRMVTDLVTLYLDFPTTIAEFNKYIDDLKSTLLEPDKNHNDNLQPLVQFVYSPQNYFFRLEDFGGAITFAEVQKYVLFCIKAKIEEHALAVGNALNWSLDQIILKAIVKDKRVFISSIPILRPEVEPHPESFVNNPEKIYTIYGDTIDQFSGEVKFSIKIALPTALPEDKTIAVQNLFEPIEAIHLGMILTANDEALAPIARYLNMPYDDLQFIVLNDQKKYIEIKDYLISLLTDKTYLNLLYTKKIRLANLEELSFQEYKNLNSLMIKVLINDQLISIYSAKGLHEPERRLLCNPLYNKFFRDKKIELIDIIGIKIEKIKLLTNLNVFGLIHENLLPFSDAKKLSIYFTKLFSNHFYTHLFQNEKMDWSLFRYMTEEQTTILINEKLPELFKNKILNLEQFFELSAEKQEDLTNERIYSLLMDKKITIEEYKGRKFDKALQKIKDNTDYFATFQKDVDKALSDLVANSMYSPRPSRAIERSALAMERKFGRSMLRSSNG